MDINNTAYGYFYLCTDCQYKKDAYIAAGIDQPNYCNFCTKRNEKVKNVGICKDFKKAGG